jgi:hypothetical protein
MAVPKKGSRRIVVDGITYVWRLRRRQTRKQVEGVEGVTVTVSREDCKGAVAVLAFSDRFHVVSPFVNTNPVLPSEVAHQIRQALAAGWEPNQPGGQFTLCVAQREPES